MTGKNPRQGIALQQMIQDVPALRQVKKHDLKSGDHLFIRTANSLYHVRILEEGSIEVSGGWFDKKGLSPMRTSVAGCTWGGSAIMRDLAAACGLCLEFGNRLITTPIQRVILLQAASRN